ncbi:MAG: hypothetical protein R3F61_35215 [Myxococcota bacterium]
MTRRDALFLDLEIKMLGQERYGRMQLRIRPGLGPAEAALVEVCATAGQDFQGHVDRIWVHPIDTRVDTVQSLVRGAVRLAVRHGLGGDVEWAREWVPPRWFQVRCVRPA